MDQTEEWRQYKDTHYWVSNHGRVRRTYKNGNEKYLKPCVKNGGYLWIDIVRKPTRIKGLIHVMVAECFIPNPESKPFVDHINGKTNDNRIENLRWATNSENNRNLTELRKDNTSGFVGVTSKKYKGEHWKWLARISLNDKRIQLGHFDKFEDAVMARREAEKKYFKEFAPERD